MSSYQVYGILLSLIVLLAVTPDMSRNPTASESRIIFRCLQELVNSVQDFLKAILFFSDALFSRALLYGGISGVSALFALSAYFCPIPGSSQFLQNLKLGLTVGGGVVAAGSGIACVWKSCKYGRTITSESLGWNH